ncbi:MAG: hypothetical protein ACLFM4_00760 [Phormidium sp.]
MVRRFLAIFLVAIALFLATPQPSYAGGYSKSFSSQNYTDSPQSSSGFLTNCWKGEPQNLLEEIMCNSVKGGMVTLGEAGVAVGTCYAADALAASVFPPAAALLPVCNAAGAMVGGSGLARRGIKAFTH